MITFNKPFLTGKELQYVHQAVSQELKLSGNGLFTKKCHSFFLEKYGFNMSLLTTSCTDALEMVAILSSIQPSDEVIVPSFTFSSTANAFVLRGAKIVFADSKPNHPGIDEETIESLINEKTKFIVPVHYAGVACNMDKIMALAEKHNLFVTEDAAQAIDSFFTDRNGLKKPLGSIGHFGCFSFHETKNIQCGEGGMLVINDAQFNHRAEIIWEKGTNRAEFFRGEVDKYGWVDIGSSFLPSEITAAFLWAQLEEMEKIQERRQKIWQTYFNLLSDLANQGYFDLPNIPDYSSNNAHLFFIVCNSETDRTKLSTYLRKKEIHTIFHYQSLHKSKYYFEKHDGRNLPNSDKFSERLLRLPLHNDLTVNQVEYVCDEISKYFKHYQ
jgi:dTDP-4-amino-4,6-dideoxygalactose transaminase